MEAIVLAGGLGTRLRSVVPGLPKPMAPVAGRPFLEIVLHRLAQQGFGRIVLSLGYQAELIQSHFGRRYSGMTLVYEIEDIPLGTGGAVRRAMDSCDSDHVFVFNGDTYLELEVDALEAVWQRDRRPIIVAREVPDTTRYGRLEAKGEEVTGFCEKSTAGPGLINAGSYVLPKAALRNYPKGTSFSLETDFLAHAVSKQPFGLFVSRGCFIDIGIPEDYLRAQSELADVVG